MKMRTMAAAGVVIAMATIACAQTAPPADAPPAAPPDAIAILKTLEARKATLKDFTAKVEINTLHLAGDEESKLGDADFVNDGKADPKFAAHFTKATIDGKPSPSPDEQVIFDGSKLILVDNKAKTFTTTTMSTPSGAPGSVTSLGGPLPLPLGLSPADVVRDFDVAVQNAPDADHDILKLVPRPASKAKFDYKAMTLTVDKKLQLPVKIVLDKKGSDVTTITLTEVKADTGAAKIPSLTPPTGPGWTVETK